MEFRNYVFMEFRFLKFCTHTVICIFSYFLRINYTSQHVKN
jgi:hypothetical protein